MRARRPAKRRRPKPPVQLTLWGEPIDPRPKATPAKVEVLDFEGLPVRVIVKDGDPWWVASDVCRVLALEHTARALARLDPDEKGVRTAQTLGGAQQVSIVSESGLYNLIFASRKPEARRFRKWVTSEVLPAIRKTGSYSIRQPSPVDRWAKKLKCDRATAETRSKVCETNKAIHKRLAAQGAKPRDFQRYHCAIHKGQTKVDLDAIRRAIEITTRQTVLDHMSGFALAANLYAKHMAEHLIECNNVPLDRQPAVAEAAAAAVAGLLPGVNGPAEFCITQDKARGRILDVVRHSLN